MSGEKIIVTPASRLTDKQREFIRRNRESIVRWLEQTEADCWEREVRQRLAEIDETDPDVIAEVIDLCRNDMDYQRWFLAYAQRHHRH